MEAEVERVRKRMRRGVLCCESDRVCWDTVEIMQSDALNGICVTLSNQSGQYKAGMWGRTIYLDVCEP